ncbi:MAG: M24 family metallopeptidase [Oscillospiraceae bacterium]|jgi:Xaa-Pro aminopeptidase|nr:M24 family metallopeptidase [Oscillospiraceae bacterium]
MKDDRLAARLPYSVREQARIWDETLSERLDLVMPEALKDAGLDMWVVVTNENCEDPLTRSLLPSALTEPRGKMVFAFIMTREGKLRKMSVSRIAGIEDVYENPWYNAGPGIDWKGHDIEAPKETQWECLARLANEFGCKRIGICNDSRLSEANGLCIDDFENIKNALGEVNHPAKSAEPPRQICGFVGDPGELAGTPERLVGAADAAVHWLSVRTEREAAQYKAAARMAHEIIDEAFSTDVIVPYVTTNDDVRWYMMQRVHDLGLTYTFECSVAVFRSGMPGMHNTPTVILPGDVVHCDFGLRFLNLCTDAQELGYVLRPGEANAPNGLLRALAITNRLQDIVRGNMIPGRNGNDALLASREQAAEEGINATVYCHPIGYYPHGAGPSVGRFSNQKSGAWGDRLFRDNTAHALELNAKVPIPEWNGQELMCCLESEVFISGGVARHLAAQPTLFHLI